MNQGCPTRSKKRTFKVLENEEELAKAAREEAEKIAEARRKIPLNEPGAAETLVSLSSPLDFSDLAGDGAKYVKYLKERLNTKSPAVVFATKAFGPKIVADFIGKRKAVRYMFAPADNTGQCKRAGLKFPPAIGTTCWLCGYELYRNGKTVDVIACEHILPVIQAVLFADIALPNLPSTSQADLVKAEYAWAHTSCNEPKSSSVFIKEIHDNTGHIVKWDIDGDEIRKILRKTIPLIRKKNIDGGQIMDESEWIEGRLVEIARRIKPILDKINFGEDTVRYNILLSAAKLLDDERLASNVRIDQEAYAEHADEIEDFIGLTAASGLSSGEPVPSRKRQRGMSRRTKRKGNRRFTRRK